MFSTSCFRQFLWPSLDTCTVYRKEKVYQVDDDTFISDELLSGSYLKVAIVFAGIQSLIQLIQWRQTPSSYTRGAQIPGARSSWRLNVFTAAPNVCGSSIWNLLRVTILAPRVFSWFLDFFSKLCAPLSYTAIAVGRLTLYWHTG
jgi:hypothetical protein